MRDREFGPRITLGLVEDDAKDSTGREAVWRLGFWGDKAVVPYAEIGMDTKRGGWVAVRSADGKTWNSRPRR